MKLSWPYNFCTSFQVVKMTYFSVPVVQNLNFPNFCRFSPRLSFLAKMHISFHFSSYFCAYFSPSFAFICPKKTPTCFKMLQFQATLVSNILTLNFWASINLLVFIHILVKSVKMKLSWPYNFCTSFQAVKMTYFSVPVVQNLNFPIFC